METDSRARTEHHDHKTPGSTKHLKSLVLTSTPDLRADIQVGLEVLDAAITDLHALRPEADVMKRIIATSDFMETVITIALYVRELATRPADQPQPVVISPN